MLCWVRSSLCERAYTRSLAVCHCARCLSSCCCVSVTPPSPKWESCLENIYRTIERAPGCGPPITAIAKLPRVAFSGVHRASPSPCGELHRALPATYSNNTDVLRLLRRRWLARAMNFLFGRSAAAERERMNNDPDIAAEAAPLPPAHPPITARGGGGCPIARLNVVNQSHKGNPATAAIVNSIGGMPALRRFTTNFYRKCFSDPHIDKFIRSHADPHGERFASWIYEKLGAGTPWSDERRSRARTLIDIGHGNEIDSPHDRSSAHFAAWHSPKRDDSVWGNVTLQLLSNSRLETSCNPLYHSDAPPLARTLHAKQHFQLDDCRVWMRLHFWSAREEGLLDDPAFADYYVRFIGHFVSVYERTAPPFARESMRWSADPANPQRYLDVGRRMPDIMGLSLQQAIQCLPAAERSYTGSVAGNAWPYEQR